MYTINYIFKNHLLHENNLFFGIDLYNDDQHNNHEMHVHHS